MGEEDYGILDLVESRYGIQQNTDQLYLWLGKQQAKGALEHSRQRKHQEIRYKE